MNIEIVSSKFVRMAISATLVVLMLIGNVITPVYAARTTPFAVGETLDPGASATPCGPLDANCFPSVTQIRPVGTLTGETGLMQWFELLNNGTSTVGFRAPDNISSNVLWTLPGSYGTVGQVLTTDASGTLSWVNAATGTLIGSASPDTILRWGGSNWVASTGFTVDITGNATATKLAILNGLSVISGGTGTTTAPLAGQILVGNGNGGYNLMSTSSLFVASSTFASSTTIGAAVVGAASTGIFFLSASGTLVQDTANFNYDSITKKLTVTGGIDPQFFQAKDVLSAGQNQAYYEAYSGDGAATSTIGMGRLRYSTTSQSWQISNSGGLYKNIVVYDGPAILATTTLNGPATLNNYLVLNSGIKDSNGATGTLGQVLSSTGTSTKWINVASGGSAASGTATSSTMYWNGSNWVENTTFLTGIGTTTANGTFMVTGTSTFATTTLTAATSTSFFASLLSAVTAFITNLTTVNATATTLVAGTSTVSNLFSVTGTTTLATTSASKLTVSGTTTLNGDLTAVGISNIANITNTNATSSNLYTITLKALSSFLSTLFFDNATGSNLVVGNITATNTLNVLGTIKDANNATGTLGQVLSSTGTSTKWINVASSGSLASGTATSSTMYWNGSNWVENLSFFSNVGSTTAIGYFNVTGTSTLATTTVTALTATNGIYALANRVVSSAKGIVTSAQFDITNNGSTDFAYDYDLDGIADANDPTITLVRGNTYVFNMNTPGHPMYIKSVQGNGTGNQYSTGVTGNGTSAGTITFTVPMSAPNKLFYNCQFHSAMSGVITVVDPTTLVNANGDTRLVATVGGVTLYGDITSTSSAVFATTTLATTTITDLAVGSTTNTGLLTVLGTTTLATTTSTNLFATVFNALLATFNNLIFNNATGTNLIAGNITATNTLNVLGTSTLATSTANNLTISQYLSILGSIKDANNATGTLGQVLSSTGTSTKWINVASGGALASGTATSSTMYWNGSNWVENISFLTGIGSSTANGNFTVNGTTTLATTTSSNFFATILNALTATIGNFIFGNATGTNLIATSSITSQGTLVVNGTTTLATTTATQFTANTATVNGNLNVTGLTALATTTINGAISGTAIDTDSALAANSDTKLVSQKAIKTYVSNFVNGLAWRPAVDVYDTVQTNAGTNIVGQANYTANGIALVNGMRLLLSGETTATTTYKDKVFLVSGVGSAIVLTLEVDGAAGNGAATTSDSLYVNLGSNGNKNYVYSATGWVLAATLNGSLVATNNLSDITNATSARYSLGLGATSSVSLGAFNTSGTTTLATTTASVLMITGNSTVSGLMLIYGTTTMATTSATAFSANFVTLASTTNTGLFAVYGTSTLATTTITALTVNSLSVPSLALSGTLSVAGTSTLATTTISNLIASENVLLASTTATGLFTIQGTSTLATTTVSKLTVIGASSLGVTTIADATIASTTNTGTLAVYGTSTLATTTATTFVVTGTSTLASTTISSLYAQLVQSITANILGMLNVAGTTTLATTTASNLAVTGTSTLATTTATGLSITQNGLTIASTTVSSTTDTLYNLGGQLYFNGTSLAGGSGAYVLNSNGTISSASTTAVLTIASTTVSTTTNALYNIGGQLYWNGNLLGAGGLNSASASIVLQYAQNITAGDLVKLDANGKVIKIVQSVGGASTTISQIGNEVTVDTATTSGEGITYVGTDKLVMAYKDAALTNWQVKLGIVSGTSTTWYGPYDTGNAKATFTQLHDIVPFNTNKFVMAFENSGSDGRWMVGEIVGTSVTFGTAYAPHSALIATYYEAKLTQINDTRVMYTMYNYTGSGGACVGTLVVTANNSLSYDGGNNCHQSAGYTANQQANGHASLVSTGPNQAMYVFRNSANNPYISFYTLNGNVVTVTNYGVPVVRDVTHVQSAKVASGTAAYIYGGAAGYWMRTVTQNGNSYVIGAEYPIDSNTTIYGTGLACHTDYQCTALVQKAGGTVVTTPFTTTGTTSVLYASTTFAAYNLENSFSNDMLTSNRLGKYVFAFNKDSSSDDLMTRVIQMGDTTSVDRSSMIGIAQATGLTNATGTIALFSGLSSIHTGFNAGALLYLDTMGAITSTTTDFLLGRAMSATTMQLMSNNFLAAGATVVSGGSSGSSGAQISDGADNNTRIETNVGGFDQNTIAFFTAGVQRAVMDAVGRIGINTGVVEGNNVFQINTGTSTVGITGTGGINAATLTLGTSTAVASSTNTKLLVQGGIELQGNASNSPSISLAPATSTSYIANVINSLYNIGGELFFNGFKLANYTATGTSYNTSYVYGYLSANQTSSSANTDHVCFDGIHASYGSDITLDTTSACAFGSNPLNIANKGRITLKAGKTYSLTSSVVTPDTGLEIVWQNADTGAIIGTKQTSYPANSTYGAGTFPLTTVFTPSVDTRVQVKQVYVPSGANITFRGEVDNQAAGTNNGGGTTFMIQTIAGQTAVTGQSVDYANAILAANQTAVNGADVLFTLQNGSLPYATSTGFTLYAGRTYNLESGLAQDGAVSNGEVTYQWRDNTNGNLIGTVAGLISANVNSTYAHNGVASAVYTPATNVNVTVRILTSATGVIKATSSYAKIIQMGTNAVTEYDAYTYSNFPTGGLIIATGTLSQYINHINVAQSTAAQALTLPNPNNTLLQRIVYINNTGTSTFTMYGTPVQAGESNAFIWTGSKWSSFGNQSVLAEFGENNSITNGGTITTTLADIAGSSFTLPSAGTWEVEYNIYYSMATTNGLQVAIYDNTNTIVTNTTAFSLTPIANNIGGVLTNKVNITTAGATTYKLRGITDAGTATIKNTVGNQGNSKVNFKKIGGYAAVTGQMVEYGNYTVTSTQTLAASTDITATNSWTAISGSIPMTSAGVWTLSAGKTYKLEANISIAGGSSAYAQYQWVDATTGTALSSNHMGFAVNTDNTGANNNVPATLVYTPSTNQTIKLRTGAQTLGSPILRAGAGGATFGGTAVTITQIGTTATTETVNSNLGNFATNSPILASGISEYTSSYQIAQTTQSITLTIPSPTNVALSRLVYIDNIGSTAFTMHGITVNGGDSVAFKWNGTAWKQFGTQAGGSNVIASYIDVYRTGYINPIVSNTNIPFNNIRAQSGTDIAYNTTTGVFTLKAGKTYRLSGNVPTISSGSGYMYYDWDNVTTATAVAGTMVAMSTVGYSTALSTGSGPSTFVVTPTVDTQYALKVRGFSVVSYIGDSQVTGQSHPNAFVEVIAGNAAVTGFSVDYVNVMRTATNQAIALNTDILFNTMTSGNIPYATSTGIFTLTAGKTYELEAGMKTRSTSTGGTGYVQYEWVDGVSNTPLTNARQGLDMHASTTLAEGQSAVAHHIYTPTSNQTVKVRVTGLSGSALEADQNRTYASIKQLGSNASTQYDVNSIADQTVDANIFATNVSQYINHVNINQTTAGRILGINSPENIALQRIIYINNIGTTSFVMHGALVAANESMAFIWNGTTWKSFGNQSNNVIAEYGEKTTFDATAFGNSSTQIMNFTLPSAGVWEVDYNISGSAAGTMGESSIWMQDATGAVISGSPQHMYSTAAANGGNSENFTADQTVRITTSSAATYYLRGQTGGATYSIYNGNCSTTGASGSCSKVSYKKISGYLAVTGQSVESYYGGYATAGINLPVAITTYQNNGILVTGNVFTLKGGKTYELKANMGVTDAGQDRACWKTFPAAIPLPGKPCNYITASAAGIRDSGEASLVYTPSVDTQVAFYDEGSISGYSDGATIFITQIGTTAVNSDAFLAVGGNIFSTALAYMNIGTLANNGLQFIASSTVVGGYAYSSTTNTATLFVGTSSPNALAMKDINLWIQGTAKLAASGTIGSALVIDQGTTGVSTTTNALYALNGRLYYNGAEIYYGASTTPSQVVASYMSGSLSTNQTLSSALTDHACFDTVQSSFGADILLDTTSACPSGTLTLNTAQKGRITLKAGKTYNLIAYPNSGSGEAYEMAWVNADTGVAIGARQSVYSNSASWSTTNNPVTTIFTPLSDTRVELRHNYTPSGTAQTLRGGAINTLGGTNTGGPTTFTIQVIAGQAAVTGQTVDYMYATRSGTNQTQGTNWASRDVLFNSMSAGNIPFSTSTGIATLTAGKTYRITAGLSWQASAVYLIQYNLVDAVTNTAISPTVEMVQTSNATNNISVQNLDFTYTPTTNQAVKIRTTASTNMLSGEQLRADVSTYFNIVQLGTTAMTSETIWSTMGNSFNANSTYDLGTLTNSGLRFTASSSAMAGLRYNASSSQGTFYIGGTTPTDVASQNFALYANGTGGFIATSTVNGNINTLYIGTSTVSALASSATNTNILALKDIQLYIDGAIMKLGKKTVNGVDIAAALVIESATSSVATTTNALYALNGQLYYNGAQIYYGASSTPNQVVASYMSGSLSANQTLSSALTDHACFDSIQTSFGSDISLDTTSACPSGTLTLNTAQKGRITLKAGKTYNLTAYPNSGAAEAYEMVWVNADTGVAISARQSVYSNSASWSTTNNPVTTIFTPSSDARVELRHNYTPSGTAQTLRGGSINTLSGTNTGGPSTFMIQVIAGAAAVTGSSVDYAFSNSSATVPTGAPVDVAWSSVSGNVSNTGTLFTLLAGKTYRLEATIGLNFNTGSAVSATYQWVDSSNASIGANPGATFNQVNAPTGDSPNPNTSVIYTPTVNTQVKVRMLTSGAAAGASINRAFLSIQQLGNTATTEYSNNILTNFTSSSTIMAGTLSEYVNHIQIAQASSSMTLSIPSPANTNLSRIVYIDNTGTANFQMHGVTVGAGEANAFKWNGTTWKSFGNQAANVAAEYGEQIITAGALNVGTYAGLANGSFTLPSAGVWEVEYNIHSQLSTALGSAINYRIVDNTSAIVTNSGAGVEPSTTSDAYLTTNISRITTTGPSVYTVQGQVQTGATGVVVSQTAYTSKVTWKKISGFIAVSGQTVDYIQVSRTATSYTTGVNTAFIYDSVQGGNIPYGTVNGQFTLSAGKTYQLTGVVRVNATLAGVTYQWYNVTGAQSFGTPGTSLSANNASTQGEQQNAAAIITPTVNTIVELRTTSAVVTNGAADASYAIVQQLGSSAITSESIVAVGGNSLSATSSFLTIGTTNNNNGVLFIASSTQLLALGAANKTATVNQGLSFDAGSTIVAGGNNVTLSSNSLIRIATSTAITITGFASSSVAGIAPTDGRIVYIMNTGSSTVTLSNQSVLSSTTARITTGTASDLSIAAGAAITMMYDLPATTWRVIGGSGSGSSVLAENGEISTIVDGQTFTTVAKDIQGSTTTIPSAGTWAITYYVFGGNSIASAMNNVYLADNTTGTEIVNTRASVANTSSAITDNAEISMTAYVTTTGPATYKLRGLTGAGTFTLRNNATGASGNGNSKIVFNKISGNAPVTGQSVDYVKVFTGTNQALAVNGAFVFSNSGILGSIPYNSGTGVFTLTAGKTYHLQGSLSPSVCNTTGFNFRWRDMTNGTLLGNQGTTHCDSSTDGTDAYILADAVYTPTTNVTVALTAQNATTFNGSQGAWAYIEQLGSSAITSETMWGIGGNSFIDTLTKSFGSVANNAIAFVSSSTERMRILATGQINVGTTTALTADMFLQGTSTNTNVLQIASSTGTILFTVAGNGRVGIGSTTPSDRLTIIDSGNANPNSGILSVYALNLTQGVTIGYTGISKTGSAANGDLEVDAKGTGSILLQTNATGNVGIKQSNPTATLDVGSANSLTVGTGKYFDSTINSINNWTSASTNVAIKAAGAVWSSSGNGFISTSDIRIKNDIASTTGALDLISLIDPVIFKYINRAEKGDKNIYGVIAQQIENIPALTGIVSHNTGFANDVYGLRSVTSEGKILADTSLLHVGDVVRLASETRTFEPKITSVDASGFTVDRPLNIESDKVLVIGRQVSNLRAVDYDQIAMLGLSAIKELSNKIFSSAPVTTLSIEEITASTTISVDAKIKALGLNAKSLNELLTQSASSTESVALIALATSTSVQATTTVAEQIIAMITNDVNSNVKVLTNMISIKVTAVVAYIDTIFAKNVHVEEKICIGKEPNVTCITKDQLDKMLESANITATSTVTNTANNTVTKVSVGTVSAEATSTVTTGPTSTEIINSIETTIENPIPATEIIAPATQPTAPVTSVETPVTTQSVPSIDPIVNSAI